jgi:selenocysteine lyase/cysteine desulfurase
MTLNDRPDDTEHIGAMVDAGVFAPAGIYLDTPTYGLAPDRSMEAVLTAVEEWRTGTADLRVYDAAVERSRQLFADIVGTTPESVAIGSQVSALVGPIAAAVPDGAHVLAPEGDFTSLLFPFLVQEERGVQLRTVPLAEMSSAVDDWTDVVAFSLVQSSSGAVADADALRVAAERHGAVTVVDATHAAGWLPFSAEAFDYVVVAAYKWLLCPRGAAFMTARDPASLPVPSVNAGWYSGESPWDSIYGTPLRLAASARRFDTSPVWFAWAGAVPSLELISSIGVRRIHAHNTALANRFRSAFGLAPSQSAIARLDGVDPSRLRAAGITAAMRADSIRVGFHLHNTSDDVDALIAVTREG